MAENKNFIEIPFELSDPNQNHENWSDDEMENFYQLFKTVLEIDIKNNPLLYTQPLNSKSYESNPNIRNPNRTSKA